MTPKTEYTNKNIEHCTRKHTNRNETLVLSLRYIWAIKIIQLPTYFNNHRYFYSTMQISVNADAAASAALEADNNGHQAMQSVEQSCNEISPLLNELSATEEVVTKVGDDVENISAVLLVIQSIAEQTDLLALNAAIQTTELSNIAVKNGKTAESLRQKTAELEGLVGQFKI